MRRHPLLRTSGFTLIELMIAMALGIFVVAAIYNVFTTQTKQLIYQDMQMEMHQNLRLATDVVSRTARMAGYGTGGQTWGVLGYKGGSAAVGEALPAIIAYDGTGPNGSDAITMVTMDPGLEMNTSFTQPTTCGANELNFDPAVFNNRAKLGQLASGEMIMCMDYAAIGGYRSFIWKITGVNSATGIVSIDANDSVYADYDAQCSGNLPMVMACSRAEVATFYVDADDTDGYGAGSAEHPVLMMDLDFSSPDDNDVPLVDDIEDMQIQYCLRTGVGSTSCTTDGEWNYGGLGASTTLLDSYSDSDEANDPDDVYMIRISFVARSNRQDPQQMFSGSRPALANNAAGTTADHYFRQTLSTEVTVRNMRLLNLQ